MARTPIAIAEADLQFQLISDMGVILASFGRDEAFERRFTVVPIRDAFQTVWNSEGDAYRGAVPAPTTRSEAA